jgi:universal stress protein A
LEDYTSILLAIDFSAASDKVLQRGCHIAAQNNATLTLLHVVEYLPPVDLEFQSPSLPDWTINQELLENNARERLQKIACTSGHNSLSREVVTGMPKQEIIRIAKEIKADLIILGSHGRHGFNRLLGSTANPVLHNAPCDVLAIRISD